MCGKKYSALPALALAFILLSCGAPEKGSAPAAAGGTHDDLVSLFQEFRAFQEPVVTNGVPDYSEAAMAEKRTGLQAYQARLAAIDPNPWPVAEKADYVLVWAEMNGMDFYQRVLKPWSRDPVFYLPSQGGAGPVIDLELRVRRLPIPDDRLEAFARQLKAVPKIYRQAERNLTEAAGDLALIALHSIDRESGRYVELASRLAEHHPGLVPDAERARDAVLNYGAWIERNRDGMTAPAGIGVENYDWWLKNVHLFPYTHAQCRAIVEHEYDRIITFLKLEEHRNRRLPELEVADTAEEWYRRLDIALNEVLEWLRREEILTVPDWLRAEDYSDPGDPDRDLPSEPTIDSRAREREVLPGETHEFIGHLFDEFRQQRDPRPIRRARRLYNMDWLRSEGWAVATEELFMMAGVLEGRPRRGREIEYLMNASHVSLSLPDLKMHAQEIDFTEARRLCAEIMPYNWSHEDDRMVWYEQQSNLRFPAFHTGCVMGKAQFTRLFRERAMQLGRDFVLRDFLDEFLAAGMIPMSLTRWEITGKDDEIKAICPVLK